MSKFCVNCGTELPDIAKFCPKCGAAAVAPTPAPTPTPVPAPASMLTPTYAAAPKPKKRREWMFFAALGLLLCVAVGVIIHFSNELAAKRDAKRELSAKLVATWDANYMKIGQRTYQETGGEMRLDLRQSGTFSVSIDRPEPELEPGVERISLVDEQDIQGTWSCPDEETLVLKNDNGQTVRMSMKLTDENLHISGETSHGEVTIRWKKV